MNKQTIKFHEPTELEISHQNMSKMIQKIHEQEDSIAKLLQKYKEALPEISDEQQKMNANRQEHKDKKYSHNIKSKESKQGIKKQEKFNNDINVNSIIKPYKSKHLPSRNNSASNSTIQLPNISVKGSEKYKNIAQMRKDRSQTINHIKKDEFNSLYEVNQKMNYKEKNGSRKLSDYSHEFDKKNEKKVIGGYVAKSKQRSLSHRQFLIKQKQQYLKRNRSSLQDKEDSIDQLLAVEQDNSFSNEMRNNQIMKPISVPIPLINQPKSQNLHQTSKPNNNKNEIIHKKTNAPRSQLSSDEQFSVPLQYYKKQLEKVYQQQCKQEINFLFFSTTTDMKEWSPQMMQLLNKHDEQLTRTHKKNKYLENFDQNYFASQFYKKNKNKQQ